MEFIGLCMKILYNNIGDSMNLVYGGSFNPPTIAHQAILEKLIYLYPEAKIIVVPVGDDYRKKDLAPFFDRLEMIKLMISSYEQVIISSIEGIHPFQGTIETLHRLNQAYDEISLVIGQDQLIHIESWIRVKELIKNYPMIIMRRNESMSDEDFKKKLKELNITYTFVDFDMDISATMYRVNPQKASNLIPKEVNDYITKHHLYKE